jgi:hypothetical protein
MANTLGLAVDSDGEDTGLAVVVVFYIHQLGKKG